VVEHPARAKTLAAIGWGDLTVIGNPPPAHLAFYRRWLRNRKGGILLLPICPVISLVGDVFRADLHRVMATWEVSWLSNHPTPATSLLLRRKAYKNRHLEQKEVSGCQPTLTRQLPTPPAKSGTGVGCVG